MTNDEGKTMNISTGKQSVSGRRESRQRRIVSWLAAFVLLPSSFVIRHSSFADPVPTAPTGLNPGGAASPFSVPEHYTKYEYRIPMRDGVKLFTVVYAPKDQSKTYPFLFLRTPYSVATVGKEGRYYGVDHFPVNTRHLGPSEEFDQAGYIFVYQDVRGRWESEGKFVEMRPHIDDKKGPQDTDTSSDMHDSVDWLLKHFPNHNGRVGIWGISYPGFNTSASIIDSHPAIKAASPEAPMTNLFMGDDAYHGGAFMMAANFGFYTFFHPQKNPTDEGLKADRFDYKLPDGYDFFLAHPTLGSLSEFFKPEEAWLFEDQVHHDTYDDYWKERNLAPHLKNIHCAVLTVGGWFDAEDLQGPFSVYKAINEQDPGTWNGLVVGPWVHGGWARYDGRSLGYVDFGAKTADYYRKNIVFPFFEKYLKDAPNVNLAKATVFETGTNQWRQYPSWPPPGAQEKKLYFQAHGALSWDAPSGDAGSAEDAYVSDPAKPVPFIGYAADGVPQEYMVADQRFASKRPDVLTYQTPPLEEDVTVAGPVSPRLFVSTSGTDSDFVVKLIDVYPPDFVEKSDDTTPKPDVPPPTVDLSGFQQLVRGEPFRGKFRRSMEKPEAFTPNQVEEINFTMPDIDHVFRRGHRIMVQVQSSWFPLTDRNPQVFMNIPDARPEDFKPATEHLHHSADHPSALTLGVLPTHP